MAIRSIITSETPPPTGRDRETSQEIIRLITGLVVNGRWGQLQGASTAKEAESYRASAIHFGRVMGETQGFKIRTKVQQRNDNDFIVWVRKVSVK